MQTSHTYKRNPTRLPVMGNENLVYLDNYGVIREEHNMSFP